MTAAEWRILVVLMVADIISGTSMVMVLPGLAAWLQIYHDPAHIGWIVSSYLLVSAAAAALLGPLGDIFGRKTVLLYAIAAVVVGALISAVAPNLGVLVAGRALQGVAGAILPLTFGIARELLKPAGVSKAVGLIIATASGTAAVGIVSAGMMVDLLGPQSIFIVIGLIAALVGLTVAYGLPASVPVKQVTRVDWLGGALFAPGIAAILLALSISRSSGWIASPTLAAVTLGAALLIVWFRHEMRSDNPLIDVRLLRNRKIMVANLAMACTAAGAMEVSEILSILAKQPRWTGAGLGLSATMVGILIFPSLVSALLASIWAGWIGARRGPTLPMVVGAVFMLAAGSAAAWDNSGVAQLIVAAVLSGIGGSAMFAGISVVILAEVSETRASEAAGFVAVVRALFQGVGSQIVAILLGTSVVVVPSGTRFPTPSAFLTAFLYVAVLSAIALLLSGLLRWSFRNASWPQSANTAAE